MTRKAPDSEVRVTVTVEASRERAFQTFVERMDAWWPRSYGLTGTERSDLIVEPRTGGRWYERTADGTQCDWGRVLVWDPPRRLVLSWQIAVGWAPEPNPERASRVEVIFDAETPTRTTVTLRHSDFWRHGEGWEAMRDGVAGEGGWPGILTSFAGVAGP